MLTLLGWRGRRDSLRNAGVDDLEQSLTAERPNLRSSQRYLGYLTSVFAAVLLASQPGLYST